MDFEELRRLPLGDALNAVVTEGGATTGGFVGAGALGRRVQAMVKSDADIATVWDKFLAWGGNNVPKIAAWYFLRGRPVLGAASADFNKGIVTSVSFDSLMRLLNDGRNPAGATVFGYEVLGERGLAGMAGASNEDVQKLVQEVTALRNENAKLKSGIQVQQVPYSATGPYDPRLPPYVGSGAIPPDERERKWGFMKPAIPGQPKPPGVAERERKWGFAGETTALSGKGKPGAAYVQAGKMFGML